MLPFISYGMKNEADGGSFLWEFSTGGPKKILSMGFTVARILRGILTDNYFSICITADTMIEKERWK